MIQFYFQFLCFVYVVCNDVVFKDNIATGPRIIGGEDAAVNEFPWQASLRDLKGMHFCGGCLISEWYVLTAAHCISTGGIDVTLINPDVVVIHLGAHYLLKEVTGEIKQRVDKVTIHPDYFYPNNDIGLLRMKMKVRFSHAIRPISLSQPGDTLIKDEEVIVSGWGFVKMWLLKGEQSKVINICGLLYQVFNTETNFGISDCGIIVVTKKLGQIGFLPNRLQRASVPVKTGKDCELVDNEKVWCIGNTKKGGCHGDSGGPLVKRIKGKWTLFGITDYAIKDKSQCIPSNGYTRYTKVGYYRLWIEKAMKESYCVGCK